MNAAALLALADLIVDSRLFDWVMSPERVKERKARRAQRRANRARRRARRRGGR